MHAGNQENHVPGETAVSLLVHSAVSKLKSDAMPAPQSPKSHQPPSAYRGRSSTVNNATPGSRPGSLTPRPLRVLAPSQMTEFSNNILSNASSKASTAVAAAGMLFPTASPRIVRLAAPKIVAGNKTGSSNGDAVTALADTGSHDQAFEFSAPRFHDFTAEPENPWDDAADAWFDGRLGSPNVVDGEFVAVSLIGKDSLGSPLSTGTKTTTTPRKFSTLGTTPRKSSAPAASKLSAKQPEASLTAAEAMDIHVVEKMSDLKLDSNSVIAQNVPMKSAASTTATRRRRSVSAPVVKHSVTMVDAKPSNAASSATPRKQPAGPFKRPASAAAPVAPAPQVSKPVQKRPLTVPVEFSFLSRERKKALVPKSPVVKKPIKKSTTSLTIPKPFRFHSTLNSTSAAVHGGNNGALNTRSPYVPLAVKVKKFETEVPDRFRLKPAPIQKIALQSLKLTQPRSPKLITKHRIKNHGTVMTSEEMEAAAIAQKSTFKAKPVDKKIFEGPIGVPDVLRAPLTVPQSPHIRKPNPAAASSTAAAVSPERIIKANPIRLPAHPFEPAIEPRYVVPEHVRLPGDEIRARKLEEFIRAVRIEEEEREKRRQFHARPMRDPNVVDSLPEVDYKPLTHPVPFHLHTSARSIVVGNDFSSMASASTTAPFTAPATNTSTTTTGASTFIAQPMPSFDQPFVPKRSARPPTECEPVQLHTDVRATERMQFEAMLQARERVDAELQARFLLEREAEELERVKLLRKETVHHAQPIRHYAHLQIQPSGKKLTEPESPMLKDKRMRLKHMLAAAADAPSMVAAAADGNQN